MDSQRGRAPRGVLAARSGEGLRMRLARIAGALVVLLSTLAATALAPTARAADPLSIEAAIDRGVTQLERAQLPDGGFAGRLGVRDSATVGEALRLARPDSPAIARIDTYLSPLALSDVDSLARAALGSPSSSASALLADQDDDGGFGLSREYQPDALDTALALRALSARGERDAARRAAERLLRFSTAGVWGADGGHVALTSEALLALDAYVRRYASSSAIDTSLAEAISWLGESQQADGSWSPGGLSVRDTALALAALASSASQVGPVGAGADALVRTQLPDGSWGDPFSTALAIRALHLAGEAIERDRVAQLADPSVQARDLSASPQTVESGDTTTIRATVINAGQAMARGVSAEFFLADPASGADPVVTAEVPDLAPGAQAVVDGTVSVDTSAGRQRVYVVLRAPAGQDRDLVNNNRAFINVYVRRRGYDRVRDWPRAGRDIQRSGTTPNHLRAGIDPDPIWRVPADGAHIAAEGKVYFGEDGRITAVDAKTGTFAWQRGGSYLDDRYRPPIYHRGFVYTAEQGQAGALNARTGEPASYGVAGWGGSVPFFTVELIPQAEGHDAVFMYDADFLKNFAPNCYIEQPFKDPTGSGWPWMWASWVALNHACDGQPLSFASDGPRGFATSAGYLTGFDVATGGEGANPVPLTPLFDVRLPAVARTPAAPLVDSIGQVVVAGWEGSGSADSDATGRGRVVAVDPDDGSVNWSFATDARLDGTPVEYLGAIIAVDRSGRVYALDQITGALKWSWQPPGYAPPAVDQQGPAGQTLALAHRYLYVPHPDGHIYTLDAGDGSELSSTMFGARPYDLAIDDTNNAIYVRTLDGQLGAYPTHQLPDQCDPANGPLSPGDIERVSFNPDASQLTGSGAAQERPAISADGRYVAFAHDIGSYERQLYVRDLETGETTALPAADQVTEDISRYDKHAPVLSADGRYLGFVASQRNSHTGDNGQLMFVLDRETGITEPVLENPDGSAQYVGVENVWGAAGDWDNPPMSISDDGQTIAFASQSNEIVPGDTNNATDVFVVNRATGRRIIVSLTSDGQQVPDASSSPSLSRDGRYVAFTSWANLTGAPTETSGGSGPYVHLYDLATGQLTAVSVTSSGTVVTGFAPYVSGDGRFVTFASWATLLLPPLMRDEDPWWWNRSTDAFVFDKASGTVELASLNDSGEHNLFASVAHPVVSDDGRYVAFHHTGVLAKGVSSFQEAQIIARDRTAGTTAQISHNQWDVSGSGPSQHPVMSADGRRLAFISTAGDLADGDTNDARDVFVYDRSGTATGSADPTDAGDACPGGFEIPGYSDLSVVPDDIQPSALEQGQPGQIDVIVHNDGEAPSEATVVRLYDGVARRGTLIGEQPLGAVAAGASTKLSFAWDPVADAGRHELTVVVDPDRAVFEQKFDNNEAEKPVDVVAPRLDLSVDPDKPEYGADEPVDFATHVNNSSPASRYERLVVSVRDAGGDEVAGVHDGQVRIAPSGETVVHGEWNTRDTSPGRYVVSARLLNAVGDELASATSSFEIKSDVHAGLSLEADQRSYDPDETATIDALVGNQSANDSLTGAHVKLSLSDPGGRPLDRWDLPAREVMQGRSALLRQAKPLRGLVPGTYHASAKLLAADGTELDEAATEFVLGSSVASGDGVRGSLTASPTDPRRLSAVTFRYAVTDDGNADIPGAIVRVRISDLTSGRTLKMLDAARTITRAGPNAGSLSTTADLAANRDYQASLHLVLADGSERALDRTIIHVRASRNVCFSIRPGLRKRARAVPGGGRVVMTVRQSNDPALPLRVVVGARRGVKVASVIYRVNGKTIRASRARATVPLSRLKIGGRNRIRATIRLTNKRKVKFLVVVRIIRCRIPPVTCKRLSGGARLRCSSSMPVRARAVRVRVVGPRAVTAKGSARVRARKGTRQRTFTVTMRPSARARPGRYLYKHVARTRRKREKLFVIRTLRLK
jgi:Tol biopolymer transport system component